MRQYFVDCMKICKITASPGSQCFPSTYQRVAGQIITGHSPCPVYTVQKTLVKVGSKDFNTISHLASWRIRRGERIVVTIYKDSSS